MRAGIRFVVAVVGAAWLGLAVSPASAQNTAAAPQPKMVKHYLALLVAGPDRSQPEAEAARIQQAHLAHLQQLIASGRALAVGPMGDNGRVLGIEVLRAASIDEARAWAEADPAVKAGRLRIEILQWWVEDGYLTPTFSTTDLEQLYFGFLRKGAAWTPESTPETQRIQAGHMAHLSKSWEAGALRLAGPIEDGGDVRGILIYRTASVADALTWANADPAVQAGRLVPDLHPWFVARGTLK